MQGFGHPKAPGREQIDGSGEIVRKRRKRGVVDGAHNKETRRLQAGGPLDFVCDILFSGIVRPPLRSQLPCFRFAGAVLPGDRH